MVSKIIHQSLQESLYQLLNADTTIAGICTGVFGQVPPSQAYPFIVIEPMQSRDWSTRTSLGFHTVVSLAVYGQQGRAQLEELLDRIYGLVVGGSLTLLDHQLVAVHFEVHDIAQQKDGITHIGRIKFKAYSEFVPV